MWNYRGDDWGMHDGYDGFWVMVVLMTVLLIAVLAFLYVLVVRPGSASGAGGGEGEPPEAGGGGTRGADRLLGERFARGEIDEDEYRRRRAVLHGA